MISHALIRVSNAAPAAMTITDPDRGTWMDGSGSLVWYGTGFLYQTITAVELVDALDGSSVAVTSYHVVDDSDLSLDEIPVDVTWGSHCYLRVTSTESGAITSTSTVHVVRLM